jgi:hypothetical protein
MFFFSTEIHSTDVVQHNCCYPFLNSHEKKEKIQKTNIKKYLEEIQKIIGARKGCWNTEKRSKIG